MANFLLSASLHPTAQVTVCVMTLVACFGQQSPPPAALGFNAYVALACQLRRLGGASHSFIDGNVDAGTGPRVRRSAGLCAYGAAGVVASGFGLVALVMIMRIPLVPTCSQAWTSAALVEACDFSMAIYRKRRRALA